MATIKLQSESDLRLDQYYEFDPEIKSSILGKGGMGIVFEGKLVHNDTGKYKRVAIKVLFKDLAEESIMRAKREASIKVVHENVIQMYDFIETVDFDGKPKYHVISEYVEGVTLSEILKTKGTLPWEESLWITKKILAGLFMLHDKGYVHRDIDPSNVMVANDGGIKLIDFGIAKLISDYHNDFQQGTLDGKFIGKVNYASPEQAQGQHWHTNASSDIYSVGILLFELMTGKLPYTGTTYEVIKSHLEQPIPIQKIPIVPGNKAITDGLKYIIEKATSKLQDKRYHSASAFITDIEKVEKGVSPIPATAKKWIYYVSAILLVSIGIYLYQDWRNNQFSKCLTQANNEFSTGMYGKALLSYQKSFSIKSSDSIASKVKMLEVLSPAVEAYINSEYTKADSLFKIAASMNSSDAYYYLGEMCYEGIGTPKDFKKGFKNTSKAAELGNKLAEYRLGLNYQNGIDIPIDRDKASRYFERAGRIIDRGVDADNPELLYVKGNMYLQGNGVIKNEKMALEFYEKAANYNYPQAQFKLYEILYNSDKNIAIQWLTKSAENGYPKAQYQLGDLLLGQKRYKESFEWAKKAAGRKYAPALRQMGAIFQVKSEQAQVIQQATGIQGNDSISYNYFSAAVDFDPDYLRGRYEFALKSYERAISLAKKNPQKAAQYLSIAKLNIDALPYTELNGKRIYDKNRFPYAEQIRTLNSKTLL